MLPFSAQKKADAHLSTAAAAPAQKRHRSGGVVGTFASGWRRCSWRRLKAALRLSARQPGLRGATLRIASGTLHDLRSGELDLRAQGMVYSTMLSLVPLLALAFSLLKGLGAHDKLEPALLGLLEPLGERAAEVTQRILGFVDRMQLGVLGSLGLGVLVYTALGLIQKIEQALNSVWHVTTVRPFGQRFNQYLSVLIVGPLLLFSALGIVGAALGSSTAHFLFAQPVLGEILQIGSRLIPFLLVAGAFTLLYRFLPHTPVRWWSALLGGAFAALLWSLLGWAFAQFVGSSSNYEAIYSAFATLILFMLWLYAGWMVVLAGASLAYHHQHRNEPLLRGPVELAPAELERAALGMLLHVAERHLAADPPWGEAELSTRLNLPPTQSGPLIDRLVQAGLLARALGDAPTLLLPSAPGCIPILRVLEAVRRDRRAALTPPPHPQVADVTRQLKMAIDSALDGNTLSDLLHNAAGPAKEKG